MSTIIVPEDIVQAAPSAPALLDDTEARRRYGRLLQTSASAARTLGDLQARFGQATDWAAAPGRFRDEVEAIGRQLADGLADDRTGRALFLRDFTSLADTHAAAFERENDVRERAALQEAYQARIEELGRLARASDGHPRNEILRQAALEAHRAHAFGLEADPAAAMDRFTVEIMPKMPMGNGFGAPDGVPADREAFEQRAREGWRHEAGPKPAPRVRAQSALDIKRAGQAFGFPDAAVIAADRDRYKDVQNVGEPREARTPENIGKDYWAAKKALDVDPNDVKSQEQLAQADRELSLYVIKKVIGDVLLDSAEDKAFGIDKLVALAPPALKLAWKGVNIHDAIEAYQSARDEVEKVRSGK